MPKDSAHMTVAEYARYRGVTTPSVRYHIHRGRIGLDAEGLVDVAAADIAWPAVTSAGHRPLSGPARRPGSADEGTGDREREGEGGDRDGEISLRWEQARRARADADIAEMRRDQQRGELVAAADVVSAWASLIQAARAELLALPARVCDRISGQSDSRVVRHMLDQAIRDALASLAIPGDDTARVEGRNGTNPVADCDHLADGETRAAAQADTGPAR